MRTQHGRDLSAAWPAAASALLAWPAGQVLGEWLVAGKASSREPWADYGLLAAFSVALVLAVHATAGRRRAILFIVSIVLILGLTTASAWQAVSTRVAAYREGPFNAAL